MKIIKRIVFLFFIITLINCSNKNTQRKDHFKRAIVNEIEKINGHVAIAFINLNKQSDTLFINADDNFHAASTMKIPVMIELFKQQNFNKFSLKDSILLHNQFKSIVDGSIYNMSLQDDSDDILYSKIGKKITLYDLTYEMITKSSNLATNVLIDIVDAKNVTKSMINLGAKNINVLRGVEDQKAYDKGLNNTTTARDLSIIMEALANHQIIDSKNSEEMISILKEQYFNDLIPFYLPKDVVIAHKTGSITGVHHDAAIIYGPNNEKYVLIILSKNLTNFEEETKKLAELSKITYNYVISNSK